MTAAPTASLDVVGWSLMVAGRGRGVISSGVLAALGLGATACMGPSGQIGRVDKAIRERIEGASLPRAPRSTLEPVPEGVRVLFRDGAVELDDVTAWSALGSEALGKQVTERGGPPWTHLPAIALPPLEGDGAEALANPALLEAFARVYEGSNAAVELRGAGELGSYTMFGDRDASFIEVVRVLYNASRAALTPPRFGVRGADGKLGTLSAHVPRLCAVGEEPAHPHSGRECWRPDVTVVGTVVTVRGRETWESSSKCFVAKVFEPPDPRVLEMLEKSSLSEGEGEDMDSDEVWAKLMGLDLGTGTGTSFGLGSRGFMERTRTEPREPPPPPPPPPCRTVTVESIEQEPARLRQAIEEIATEEPCSTANVQGSNEASWQDVITAFDVVRSLGYEDVSISAPPQDDMEGCVPAGG